MANEECTVRIGQNGSERSEELGLKIQNEDPNVEIPNQEPEMKIVNEELEVKLRNDEPEVKAQSEDPEVKFQNEEPEANSPTQTDELDHNSPLEKQKQSLSKITVVLSATADAPILKHKKWVIDSSQNMCVLSRRLRKMLKLPSDKSVFLYINQAFSPALDTPISNLYECYGGKGVLHISYHTSHAWG